MGPTMKLRPPLSCALQENAIRNWTLRLDIQLRLAIAGGRRGGLLQELDDRFALDFGGVVLLFRHRHLDLQLIGILLRSGYGGVGTAVHGFVSRQVGGVLSTERNIGNRP